MPQHSRNEVADLTAFATDEDRADNGLADIVKQSQRQASDRDEDPGDEPDEDEEDEDLDDEEDDDDQDEDEDDEEEDEPATPEGSKAKGIASPLPPRNTVPRELLPAYDALAAAKKAQDSDYTKKTQALSQKLGSAEKMVSALEGSGADLEQVSQMIVEMVEVSKNGGDPASVVQKMNGSSPAPSSPSQAQDDTVYDIEKVIEGDEELESLANQLANPYGLTEDQLDVYEAAYRNRETALILAVEAHNQKVETRKSEASVRRSEQLSRLKSDPYLGRIVTKNEAALLAEAQQKGVSDLEMYARHRYFEDAIKRAEKRGSKRFSASRERNLDVGDGDTGRYDVSDTRDSDLDRGFEEGGLAGMIAVGRRSLTGRRKR